MMRRIALIAMRTPHDAIRCFGSLSGQSTKNNPFLKQLDVYARRDVQLAPYLLREVDIEYKRKCNKVKFCFWMAILVALSLYDMQLQNECVLVMMGLADLIRQENDAKDEDFSARRQLFAKYLVVLKEAFARDQKWTVADTAKVTGIMQNASSDDSLSS